jgi:peptide/nickel transport system ATP-binding protein
LIHGAPDARTHNLPLVGGIAECVSVLFAGRIAETGPTEVVLRNPISAEARKLLAHTPRL